MEIFSWDDNLYSVKVLQIDEHHKKLVNMISKLYSSMMQGKGKDVLLGILFEMKDYAKYHFSTEEKLMNTYNYKEFSEHKNEHDLFITKADDLFKEYNDGKIEMSIDTFKFLKNWLINHILINDKKMAEFLISNGVK